MSTVYQVGMNYSQVKWDQFLDELRQQDIQFHDEQHEEEYSYVTFEDEQNLDKGVETLMIVFEDEINEGIVDYDHYTDEQSPTGVDENDQLEWDNNVYQLNVWTLDEE